jgi:hypothetical protein
MILALAEKHRGRQPTRRRCHTRGTAGIQGQTTARQRPRAASPAMQHNARFGTPQFKDAKRPAAEHSGGYFALRSLTLTSGFGGSIWDRSGGLLRPHLAAGWRPDLAPPGASSAPNGGRRSPRKPELQDRLLGCRRAGPELAEIEGVRFGVGPPVAAMMGPTQDALTTRRCVTSMRDNPPQADPAAWRSVVTCCCTAPRSKAPGMAIIQACRGYS